MTMFSFLKSLIWLAGLVVVSYFVLGFFGYEFNLDYFKETRSECEKRLQDCGKELVKEGTNNAQCDFKCVDPQIIIRKK